MLLATTLQSHTEAMPGLPSLGEKRWAHPLPLATIPPGAWHRYTPPCLCAPWHPSHGLICHSLTLALSTGLTHGRQLSGQAQHLFPLPFFHLNGVLSIVRDINIHINTLISYCCFISASEITYAKNSDVQGHLLDIFCWTNTKGIPLLCC